MDLCNPDLFDSQTLFNEMAGLSANSLYKIQQALLFVQKHSLRAVIIGGMAVAHWSSRLLTPDVDFLTDEMSRLLKILQTENIEFQHLASEGNFGGIEVPSLGADFLDANIGNRQLNHYVIQTAKTARIGGVEFLVADPNVLMLMKFTLERNKDTEDAFNLLQSQNINKQIASQHLKSMQKAIGKDERDTIRGYLQAF